MNTRARLLLAGALIAIVWQLPYGARALYPLSLLATWAHEMGHGLTALLMGQEFVSFVLHADGSGLARWQGNPGALARACIAAGGLLGPSIAGAAVLIAARSPRHNRWVLLALVLALVLSVALWTRNLFGIAFLLGAALVLGAIARWLDEGAATLVLHVLGLTLCLSLYKDFDYMLSDHAVIAGTSMVSDSGQIAQALWLPYWFWGTLIAVLAGVTVLAGVWAATPADK